jgi:hypothetical protein
MPAGQPHRLVQEMSLSRMPSALLWSRPWHRRQSVGFDLCRSVALDFRGYPSMKAIGMWVILWWLLGYVAVFGIVAGLLWSLVFFMRRSGARRRSPLTRNLLRNPGDSIRPEIQDLNNDLMGLSCFLMVSPLLIYSIWLSQVHFRGVKVSLQGLVVLGVAALAGMLILWWRLRNVLERRRSLYLALDGEIAIGQELNQLMQKGHAVFHDLPAERFNIDHVVVAPGGVFAVETKARAKHVAGDAKAEAEVIYDGQTLRFPCWQSAEFLDQAARQAVWLSRWLTSAVGESIDVKPVLALPGWFVKRVQRGPVQIISGRDAAYLVRESDNALSPSMVQRIAHQLDARCRTVEPRAYPRTPRA